MSSARPINRAAVVGELQVVGAPVDKRVGMSEPRFAKDEVVFPKWVEERLECGRVCVALEGDVGGVRGDGEGAVGNDNGNR